MSQVQNNVLHNFVQPALFLGAVFFAGSSRNIQYFPGASKGGLFLSAGLGTALALGSQKIASDKETAQESFFRVSASLVLGAAIAPFAAKALKGRVELSFLSSLRMAGVELVLAAAVAGISSQLKGHEDPHAELKAKRATYESDPAAWKALKKEERNDFIRECFKADLAPISLVDQLAVIDADVLKERNFSGMTNNQLRWHAEVLRYVGGYSDEEIANLFVALNAKQLPMYASVEITAALINHATEALQRAYFLAHPLQYFIQAEKDEQPMIDLFDSADTPDAPSRLDYCRGLKLDDIRQLNLAELTFISEEIGVHATDDISDENVFSDEQRAVLSGVMHVKGVADGGEIWPITQEIVTVIQRDNNALEWFYDLYSKDCVGYALLEEDLIDQLDAKFVEAGKAPIEKDIEGLLDALEVDAIDALSGDVVASWYWYFQDINSDLFDDLEQAKAEAFINAFIQCEKGFFSLDKVTFDVGNIVIDVPLRVDDVKDYSDTILQWIDELQGYGPRC